MTTIPRFPADNPAASTTRRWWLSLFPRLSAATKRSLLLLSLSATLLVSGQWQIGNRQRDATSPYTLPAVQHALHQLGLPGRDPVGEQFQVNSYTTNHQGSPAVALDSDGDFVVAWRSWGSYGSDTDVGSIQGQRYNSVGTAQGSQFQVNSYTTGHQDGPAVALDSDGDFVVVWGSWGSYGSDTEGNSIQGQRYNSVGTAQGSQFQINSYTTNNQNVPDVAMDSDGDFVVVWGSSGSYGSDTDGSSIQGQRYNSVGTAQSSQFQVNTYTTNNQWAPAVALDSDGDFVVVWHSNGSSGGDTSNYSIQGQGYNSAGTAQGSQFQVNIYTTDFQVSPAVALDSDGDFVVVWDSRGSDGGDTDFSSIQGQRYNSAGTAQGSQFQVNSYTTSWQTSPAVALDSDGDFVVVWTSDGSVANDQNGDSIQGQSYNSAGTAQGSQFQVNTYRLNDQNNPVAAMDSNGDYVVVWQSDGSNSGDTSSYSIQGQRFMTEEVTPTPTPTPSNTPTDTPTPTHTPTATPTTAPAGHTLYLPAVLRD
jgi:hypothetical protein